MARLKGIGFGGVLVLVFLISLPIAAATNPASQGVIEGSGEADTPGLIPRGPIRIVGDSDFEEMGFAGDGSETNPYVIEGYLIEYNGVCINIAKTTAHFVVRDHSAKTIILELLSPKLESEISTNPQDDLVANLLRHNSLTVNSSNEFIFKALITHGLPVTRDMVEELSDLLANIGTWGEAEAHIASALKAAGLPLTPEVVHLFHSRVFNILESFIELRSLLQATPKDQLPDDLHGLFEDVEELLNDFLLEWQSSSAE